MQLINVVTPCSRFFKEHFGGLLSEFGCHAALWARGKSGHGKEALKNKNAINGFLMARRFLAERFLIP
ncbi:hypothetical protein VCJ_001067 [Vibrio metoecus]|nr:hypothetical protein VCJ_001067 [Vibrio metoecus]